MQIGALAKSAGVSVQTIRYYERYGLLPTPERKSSSYRIYTAEHTRRLRFIIHAKTLGFMLEEIKKILDLSRKQQCPCGQVVRIAEQRLTEISEQLEQLSRFKRELTRAVSSWKKSPEQAPAGDAICVLIERTMVKERGNSHAIPKRRSLQMPRSRVRM